MQQCGAGADAAFGSLARARNVNGKLLPVEGACYSCTAVTISMLHFSTPCSFGADGDTAPRC